MNLPPHQNGSLFPALTTADPGHLRLTLPLSALGQMIETAIASFESQAISATVWLKLPPSLPPQTSLESYLKSGLANPIYHCSVAQTPEGLPERKTLKRGQSVVLEANQSWEQDYFLILLSPQLCGMFLFHAPDTSQSLDLEAPFNVAISFQPTAIADILARVRKSISITDSTPEELMVESVPAFALPTHVPVALITELLRRHLQPQFPQPSQSPSPAIQPQEESFGLLEATIPFLVSMTREMSTPLTSMKTALRLLESMQQKREQRQRYLDLLKRECDRQNSLITGLQELIQIHQTAIQPGESVQLEDCVPGIVSIYQPIATEKGIDLGCTIARRLPAVACSASAVRSMLQHLLHNSLKFTPDQGRVQVKVTAHGKKVEIVVSDTGTGIERSDLPKLFHSFYRGRNALGYLPGAGLGLTIVKQLLERYGGSITVQSHIGRGSHFQLLLPIHQAEGTTAFG